MELLRQLFEVSSASNACIHRILAAHDLNETTAGVLWLLDRTESPVPMRDIARLVGCDPSNVTLISDRLEPLGLVERRPHPSDGRARVLALTEAGHTLWSTVLRELTASSPLTRLTVREQSQLSGLLNKLAQ